MANNYNDLLTKLDSFIRKYYQNQLLKGLIYGLGLTLLFYLAIVLLESFGRFSTSIRAVLFYGFLSVVAYILVRYIFIPLSKIFRLGKILSYNQASDIIGNHFTDIQDKLLNTLQLKDHRFSGVSSDLLNASIDQRISELSPVPFTTAVNFGENKKYLGYLLAPLFLGVLILAFNPETITESTTRIVQHQKEFIPIAPFEFQLLNKELRVAQQGDFELRLQIKGDEVPASAFVQFDNSRFRMKKENNTTFSFELKNIASPVDFRFFANDFYSTPFTLTTFPTPSLVNIAIDIKYPKHSGLGNDFINNSGDLSVPEGSVISWKINTKNSDKALIHLYDSSYALQHQNNNEFQYKTQVFNSNLYSIINVNLNSKYNDTVSYQLTTVPDARPSIAVVEMQDSSENKLKYFTGDIADDYGFTKLLFHYTHIPSDDSLVPVKKSEEILLSSQTNTGVFYHTWSLGGLNIKAGDEVQYFFEIWDNDGIRGTKSSRTKVSTYFAPTANEIEQLNEENNTSIKNDLEKSIEDAKALQKELEKFKKDLLEKNELSWQEKKKLEELLEKQKALQKQILDAQKNKQENEKRQKDFQPINEELLKKQERINELFEQLIPEEMKEMYEEMEKLMEEMDKEKIQEQLEKMDNESLEKELDRTLEMFKELEFEQKMDETMSKMDELIEKQKDLNKKTEEETASPEELKEKQDKLNDEFEQVKEDLETLEKLNEELEDPNEMPDTEEQENSIEQEMKNSSDQLEQKKNKKASQSQKNAAQQMQQMKDQMQAAMDSAEEQASEENMEDLRMLLENIIELSFSQEQLIASLTSIGRKDPKYVSFAQEQRKLKDDTDHVADSLFALSKRVEELSSIINKEVGLVQNNMLSAIREMADRNTPKATVNQQFAMTSLNNLALLFDEALQQMMKQQAEQKPGNGNCNKPGGNGSKPSKGKSAAQMNKMQKALSKKLERMKGNEGKGRKSGKGESRSSKEIAKMAAEQRAIREALNDKANELNQKGGGEGNELKKLAEEMEEIEQDIVNQRISQETLNRQEDILIKLLEHEKAERERDQDNKRESKEAFDIEKTAPTQYLEYQKLKEKEIELLRTIPPNLKPYYRNQVNDYFNKLGAN